MGQSLIPQWLRLRLGQWFFNFFFHPLGVQAPPGKHP